MIADAATMRSLPGHVPPPAALTHPLGPLPAATVLKLAIGLPIRNASELTNFLRGVYDPHSPFYHHYLTPAQFNEKFGPTPEQYQTVAQFARSNGFTVLPSNSRTLLDIQAKVSDVERAFHVKLLKYQHPTEARTFFAPNVEPTVDTTLPILNVDGLSNYELPRPALRPNTAATPPAATNAASPH